MWIAENLLPAPLLPPSLLAPKSLFWTPQPDGCLWKISHIMSPHSSKVSMVPVSLRKAARLFYWPSGTHRAQIPKSSLTSFLPFPVPFHSATLASAISQHRAHSGFCILVMLCPWPESPFPFPRVATWFAFLISLRCLPTCIFFIRHPLSLNHPFKTVVPIFPQICFFPVFYSPSHWNITFQCLSLSVCGWEHRCLFCPLQYPQHPQSDHSKLSMKVA